MTQYALAIDTNRCVGCMACNGACKMINDVPIGNFWNKVLRVGPNPSAAGEGYSTDFYYLAVQCQHCADPECTKVCPTQASHKREDGTVQVDKSKCIGCQFCVMACPYGVRYLNETEKVVEKCTLCEQQIAQGELPQCVINCVGMAKWFGDIDEGIESFKGPYGATIGSFCEPYSDSDIHYLPDVGNKPSFVYILRKHTWQGGGN
jgi:Fe-S-cluster-containing dehydrogenase component